MFLSKEGPFELYRHLNRLSVSEGNFTFTWILLERCGYQQAFCATLTVGFDFPQYG